MYVETYSSYHVYVCVCEYGSSSSCRLFSSTIYIPLPAFLLSASVSFLLTAVSAIRSAAGPFKSWQTQGRDVNIKYADAWRGCFRGKSPEISLISEFVLHVTLPVQVERGFASSMPERCRGEGQPPPKASLTRAVGAEMAQQTELHLFTRYGAASGNLA